MPTAIRTILAVVLGLAVGSAVNMGLVLLGGRLVAPPAGADVTTTEGLRASMHLFEARHFVFPFLAHALGTLTGSFGAGLLAPGRSAVPAYAVAGFFLLGGVAAAFMLPAPAWFIAVDLLLAYLPAGWLGLALARRLRPSGPGRAIGGRA